MACGSDSASSPGEYTVPASVQNWRQDKPLVAAIASLPTQDRAEVSRFLDTAAALEASGKSSPIIPGMSLNEVLIATATAQPEAPPAEPSPPVADPPAQAAAPADPPSAAASKPIPYAAMFEPSDCEFAETEDGTMELYEYCEAIGGLDCGVSCPDSLEPGQAKAAPAPKKPAPQTFNPKPFVGCYFTNGRRMTLAFHASGVSIAWGSRKHKARIALDSASNGVATGRVYESSDSTAIPVSYATMVQADGRETLYLSMSNRTDLKFLRYNKNPNGCHKKHKR